MKNNWFHVSDTLTDEHVVLSPQPVRSDDRGLTDPCICVCPTVDQCLIALGILHDYEHLVIYQTRGNPIPQNEVFDYSLTKEHRFFTKQEFTKIGELRVEDLDLPWLDLTGVEDEVLLRNLSLILAHLKIRSRGTSFSFIPVK